MQRYFIYLSYNGKNYCGWQVQPNGITVQQKLEEALTVLLRQEIAIVGAGRTDSGVHARSMIAHFDCDNPDLDMVYLTQKLNRFLPPDIAIDRIAPVTPEAHARFDAVSRTYKYFLSHKKDPFNSEFVYFIPTPLDYEKMNEAALILFDFTDFTSFSKLHTDVKTNNCRIDFARWTDEGGCHVFTITADRFLRNMVRAIIGTLIDVGRGKLSLADFRRVIESKDRGKAGTSAPAHALFLWDVSYPEKLFT